jgi:hypothetical protein
MIFPSSVQSKSVPIVLHYWSPERHVWFLFVDTLPLMTLTALTASTEECDRVRHETPRHSNFTYECRSPHADTATYQDFRILVSSTGVHFERRVLRQLTTYALVDAFTCVFMLSKSPAYLHTCNILCRSFCLDNLWVCLTTHL